VAGHADRQNEIRLRFRASLSPVTNAVNRLGYEQLVVIEPQRGSFVAPIVRDDILQLMSLRPASGLRKFDELLDDLRPHLDRVRLLMLPSSGRMEGTLAEHEAIVKGIVSGNVRRAEAAMRSFETGERGVSRIFGIASENVLRSWCEDLAAVAFFTSAARSPSLPDEWEQG
jgi:DNA-binding GntR family transcriptional regulator